MAYSVATFAASQTIGFPNIITLTDQHVGTDAAVTGRKVYLTTAAGTYLVPSGTSTDYVLWAIANSSINLDVLTTDMALNIRVDWIDVSNNVLYTKTILFDFTMYSETFYYGLTQNQTSYPNIVDDTNYYNNKMKLRCSIDEANNSVTYGSDIYSSQSALDRAAYLIANQNNFF